MLFLVNPIYGSWNLHIESNLRIVHKKLCHWVWELISVSFPLCPNKDVWYDLIPIYGSMNLATVLTYAPPCTSSLILQW